MALASAQVVDKIADLLAAGATAAGTRVYTSRFWPLAAADLPAMRVYADDERIERAGIGYPWTARHTLLVLVDSFVMAVADLDDAMHNIVEQALGVLFGTQAAAQLSPLVGCDMQPVAIERSVEQFGGADVGRARLALQINFHTASNAPGTLT